MAESLQTYLNRYQRAEEAIDEVLHINVNDDTIRQVANYVGGTVFQNDCQKAEDAFAALDSGKLRFTNDVDGVIYIQADGAALNTRLKDEDGVPGSVEFQSRRIALDIAG